MAACGGGPPPVPVAVPSPAAAVGSVCSRLASQLPNKVDDLHRRRTTPLAAGVAAWGDPPVILRCGVGLPAGLTATSVLSTVDDVDWFTDEQATRRVWTTFSRAANVEVSVPNSHSPGVGPVVDLAAAIKATDPTVAPPQLMDGHMHMQMPTPSP